MFSCGCEQKDIKDHSKKNRNDEMEEKMKWGKQNVGIPSLLIEKAIETASKDSEFKEIRFDAIKYYCDRLLFRALPEEMYNTLSVEQLKVLSPDVVKVVYLLLIRDMMQRFRYKIITKDHKQSWDTQSIELLTVKLFELTDAPLQPYIEWIQRQEEGVEENSKVLILGLSKRIGLEANVLWNYHDAMCEIVNEDILTTDL